MFLTITVGFFFNFNGPIFVAMVTSSRYYLPISFSTSLYFTLNALIKAYTRMSNYPHKLSLADQKCKKYEF